MPRRASRYIQPRIPPAVKLAAKTGPMEENGCIYFLGALDRDGYGQVGGYNAVTDKQTTFRAHKIAYEEKYGPVPVDKVLDHICHDPNTCPGGKACLHRKCINPDHVTPVPVAVNGSAERRTGQSRESIDARVRTILSRPHCRKGHAYISGPTIVTKEGWRRCRECLRGYAIARIEKRKATSNGI